MSRQRKNFKWKFSEEEDRMLREHLESGGVLDSAFVHKMRRSDESMEISAKQLGIKGPYYAAQG